jgi:hypothetical protein
MPFCDNSLELFTVPEIVWIAVEVGQEARAKPINMICFYSLFRSGKSRSLVRLGSIVSRAPASSSICIWRRASTT